MSMLITNAGRAAISDALANGTSITITEMAFGTEDRFPTGGETELVTEVLRKPVIAQGVSELQTYFDAQLEVEDGPFVIYEVGLFDENDVLLFVGRVEGLNKPVQQDQPVTVDMRVLVLTSQFQNVTVTVDSSFSYAPTDRMIATNDGLAGGGDLTQNRTLKLSVGTLQELDPQTHQAADRLVMFDASADVHRKLSASVLAGILAALSGGAALATAARSIATSDGIKGGGDLSANRSFKLDLPGLGAIDGDSVNVVDLLALWDESAQVHKKVSMAEFFKAFAALRGATAADLLAAALDSRFLSPAAVGGATAFVPVTDQATVTLDFNAGRNFTWEIGGDRLLANPQYMRSGQTGEIEVTQDATGGRAPTFGSAWKFFGGVRELSPDPGAVDVISYKVVNSGRIMAAINSLE